MKRDNSSSDAPVADISEPPSRAPDDPVARRAALRAAVRVERALTELRRGRPVRLQGGAGGDLFVATVETLAPDGWTALLAMAGSGAADPPGTPERAALSALDPLSFDSDPVDARLILSAERVRAIGWPLALGGQSPAQGRGVPVPPAKPVAVAIRVPTAFRVEQLAVLAGLGSEAVDRSWQGLAADRIAASDGPFASAWDAALTMARLARLVPAVVVVPVPPAPVVPEADQDVLCIDCCDLAGYPMDRAATLLRISEAPVPLAGHENSRFVLFREAAADIEHVAIVVGDPDPRVPVLVRLHSSCLTGDLFGSLRCDCGDQLRGAIDRLGHAGGGVLLYLAQEGRGIGLANKLRAYARQDGGADTIDADRSLGFSGDERRFDVAAQMLRLLDIARVRLLTNNPRKIEALRSAGLDVVERLPIAGAVNRHNERYLTTKRDRAGHLIDVSVPVPVRQVR